MRKTINQLKKMGLLVIMLSFMLSCAQTAHENEIAIKNPSAFDRHELISIPYSMFSQLKGIQVDSFKIVDAASGQEYPYQFETLGKNETQNLLIQVFVPASETIRLSVQAGIPDPVSPKTFARYVPERLDDFAWENDQVAFRMYGEALEGKPGDAQGMDIWTKRTNDLIINKWYKSDDYHKDYGEGLDYYSVGQTLGAGDVAPYIDGQVHYSKHYREYEILDNGPLRTTFRLDYEPWEVKEDRVQVSKTISIDAGSQLNKITLDFNFDQSEELTIAAGIARRKEPGEVLDKHKNGIFGYWEPPHGDDGITGVGLVFENPIDSINVHEDQYLSLFQVKAQAPMVYYVGGAWNKAGRITSSNEWLNYLEQYKTILENPLEIKIN